MVWLAKLRLVGLKLTGLLTVPVPVPARAIICGLRAALSLMVIAPAIDPATVGEKVALTVHFAFAAIVPVQVLAEIAKSPLAFTVPIVSGVGELVNVTVRILLVLPMAVLGKERMAGVSVTGATPFPVRLTTCVPGVALSRRVMAPSMDPNALGEKLTVTVHVAPGARLAPQVVVLENSPLPVIAVRFRVLVVPVFFTVTDLDALAVPTA